MHITITDARQAYWAFVVGCWMNAALLWGVVLHFFA